MVLVNEQEKLSILHHNGWCSGKQKWCKVMLSVPPGNAVTKMVLRKVRWRAVIEMVPACSSAEYKGEEGTDSWTVIVHVCTCHILTDIGLVYIQHIYCIVVKGAKISK